ncbi:MAG: hypothetical protein A3F09_01735 [Chlamydiae bacterium RIFCSPHIGHO2_12_FULL_49_11]|nr:MAG: hypothetical protein A3F09_01735 [Chlamydiae bacterium RIFCSPHIGHO2_12_FULL_49_11]
MLAVLITFAMASLSATIVFPIFAPLFLSETSSIFIRSFSLYTRTLLLGVFLASFPLAQFFFSPVIGDFSDHRGRKKAFLLTLAIETIGYFVSAWGVQTVHLSLLFLGRLLTGLAAGNVSVCLATLVDLSRSEKEKVRYFSFGSIIMGIAFVLGPFIGGKLSDASVSPLFSLAFPMWIGFVLTLFNFCIVWLLFHETMPNVSRYTFKIAKAIENVELAFRTNHIRDLYLIYFYYLFSWNMIYQFLPAVMVSKFASLPSMIGDASALMGLVWIVGSAAMLWLMHTSLPMKRFLILFLIIFSFLGFFVSVPETYHTFLWVTSGAVLFAGSMWPIFTSAISNAADQSVQGKIMGLSQSIQSLAMVLAPLIGGFLIELHTAIPFILSSTSALLAGLFLTRTKSLYFQM